ncbi:uncharacterized protein LOC115797122 isoform X3 [Archocentrus centrarchus]|uniref:uncharacterized protein LOC115797122 isoform X3 n=1 Tax=Archocentrus centrarchus TaxID=63155 RepID=UPI0011E9F29D|nr:uncharacterized protein LOC115797122 isoform X3 [Archocentrus centrarchus]
MQLKCLFPFHSVTLVKTTGRGPDITPVCSSENPAIVLLVKCWISTERHTEVDCCLVYTGDKPFKDSCDSRFSLRNVNHTVFLHLTSLTAEDSGNYTCECSYETQTQVLSLDITVESEDGPFSGMKFMATVIIIIYAAATLITATGIICGHILMRTPHRETGSGSCNLTRSETLQTLDAEDPYMSLQRPTSDIYQTLSSGRLHHDADSRPTSSDVTVIYINTDGPDGKEHDLNPGYAIYETVKD